MRGFNFDFLDVLGSEIVDGEVRLKVGYSAGADAKGTAASVAMYGIDGFISRPNDPDDAGTCQARVLSEGNDRTAMASRDNRIADKVGALQPGDRAVVSNGEARLFLKNAKDTIALYSRGSQTDKSLIVEVNGEKDRISFVAGKCAIALDAVEGSITITVGATTIQLRPEGFFVFGSHAGINTGTVNLATVGPLVPQAPVFSALVGPTALAGVPSSRVTIGV